MTSAKSPKSAKPQPPDTREREVQVFKDRDGDYRWRRMALRGNLPDEIVADGSQGYSTKASAVEAAARENPGLDVVELD